MTDTTGSACAWLIERLHALVEDREFRDLTSQSAMLEYALRRIPELVVLGNDVLNFEIQELKTGMCAGFD